MERPGRLPSPEAVQKILGYASITTAARYADHLETAELRSPIPALLVYSAA
jgi:hypothetical protein